MTLDKMTDAEILLIVNPIMDNLMGASTKIDQVRHTRDFTDRLKAIVTREYLEKVCKSIRMKKGSLLNVISSQFSGDPPQLQSFGNNDSQNSKEIS